MVLFENDPASQNDLHENSRRRKTEKMFSKTFYKSNANESFILRQGNFKKIMNALSIRYRSK